MVINMLTRWFNFEFGVPSHLSPVSMQSIAILKLILFIPMVAPSSDQWRNSILMVRWRHHSLRLRVVCTCPPKTMSSAWKCLPSPHFTNTYEAKKYSLKLFKGLYMSNIMHFLSHSRGGSLMTQQLSTWVFTHRSNLWRDALGTGTAHCFGCDHYALKFI